MAPSLIDFIKFRAGGRVTTLVFLGCGSSSEKTREVQGKQGLRPPWTEDACGGFNLTAEGAEDWTCPVTSPGICSWLEGKVPPGSPTRHGIKP